MGAAPTAVTPRRLSELDALRVIAFGLLILYHVGMFYVSWDWVVKSPRPVPALEPLMRLSSPWRLGLLFLVAGAALRLMLTHSGRSVRNAMASRSKRLLLPLAFGMLVVVPPQPYLEVVEKFGYTGSYLDFMGRYLRADHSFCRGGNCLMLPTWNHLWFVAYAWVYSMLALALVAAGKVAVPWRPRLGEGTRLLWLPWLWLAGIRIVLAPLFPSTHNLLWDWANHALFCTLFALGWTLFGHADDRHGAWRAAERLRWPALWLALAAWGLLMLAPSPASTPAATAAALRSIAALTQWLPVVAALGFARRHLRGRDGPLLRHLGEPIFPCYILHQTITVVAGHHLARLGWPQPLEAVLLVVLTLGGSWAGYLAVRRFRLLRPLFGLASARTAALNPRAAPAAGR
jgi:glucan biosynthesis protein C